MVTVITIIDNMPTIDNFPIPDFICQHFHELIDAAPNADILALARLNPELVRGIRPSPTNIKLIRQRLRTMLNVKGPLDASLCHILGKSGFNMEFIALLSEQVLQIYLADLAAVYGSAKTLGAMLVDERQPVRELAINFLTEDADITHDEDLPSELQLNNLSSELEPFLTHIKMLLPEIGKSLISNSDNSKEKQSNKGRKISRLGSELNKLLKSKKRLEKTLNDKISKKDAQLTALKEQVGREKLLGHEQDEKIKILEEKLANIQGQVEQKIDRQVEQIMSSNIRGWLVEPQKVAAVIQKLSKGKGGDIKQRALRVLHEQEEIDRHFGNRSLLTKRQSELEELKGQVDQAVKEALNPLPELNSVSFELEKEINGIKKTLGVPFNDNPWCQKLAELINQAGTQTEFNNISHLLEQLGGFSLLNKDEKCFQDLYNSRLAVLYEKYSPRAIADKSKRPVQLIKDWHRIKGPFVLVVDGYNAILSLPEIFSRDYEDDGRPGSAARRHLLQIIDRMLGESNCLAEVFFDGEVADQENFSARVRVVFSGGGDREVPDRADAAIITYLTSLPENQDGARIIITDDQELQALARQQDAKIMPLAQFAALIY